jgi:hypothetical protein
MTPLLLNPKEPAAGRSTRLPVLTTDGETQSVALSAGQ